MNEQQKALIAARTERTQWFLASRFGMFIHWGLYAIPARGEWVMNKEKIPVAQYEKLAAQFNPVKFNAEEWVQVAKDAGMKYMVITAKHHDGFSMYDSDVTSYDVVDATPFKRDVVKELADACAKGGIKFGVYYSHSLDWRNKGGKGSGWDPAQDGDFDTYLNEFSLPQIKEIVTKYNPAVIWFDMPAKITPELARKFVETVRSIHPEVIINSRLMYSGPRTMNLKEDQLAEMRDVGVDYLTYRDREIPQNPTWRDWETCMTLNSSWGYTADDHRWKDPREVIKMLVRVVHMDGNFLLNFGPTAEGEFPDEAVDIVRQVGAWLRVNREAIYGVRKSALGNVKQDPPYERKGRMVTPDPEIFWLATERPASAGQPAKIYLHLFKWPIGRLEVQGITNKIGKAYLLSDKNRPLTFSQKGEAFSVDIPESAPDPIASVVCLECATK